MNAPSSGNSWVDLTIFVVLVFFLWQGTRFGFWIILADFLSFFLALLCALWFYPSASTFLRTNFSLGRTAGNAVGFLMVAVASEAVLGYLFSYFVRRIPTKFKKHKYLKLLSPFPALGEGLVLISFFLTLLMSLPVAPRLKTAITYSQIGGVLVKSTSDLERSLSDVFGKVVADSLTHLMVSPESTESIPLEVGSYYLTADEVAESKIFDLINSERKKVGVNELIWEADIVPVARAYAMDMWERKYFGHYSPEGDDAGDRLDGAGISFRVAGENLALAPSVEIAQDGLMNSSPHRANILSEEFTRVGIGVVDNGYYGKMFVEIFTD